MGLVLKNLKEKNMDFLLDKSTLLLDFGRGSESDPCSTCISSLVDRIVGKPAQHKEVSYSSITGVN